MQQPLSLELNHSPSRTESSTIVGNFGERAGWARLSAASSSRTGGISTWEHHRRTSMAPSLASTWTAEGLTSPGLGMGPIGEFGGALMKDEAIALSPPPIEGRESPKPIFRTSPSGGITYVLNGVPKNKVALPRPPVRRSFSLERPRSAIRSFSVGHSIFAQQSMALMMYSRASSRLPNGRQQMTSNMLIPVALTESRALQVRLSTFALRKPVESDDLCYLRSRMQVRPTIRTTTHQTQATRSLTNPVPSTFPHRCQSRL